MTLFDSYHNTTHLDGAARADAERKALTQEERILALFSSMPDGWRASPSTVHKLAGGRSPLTSTRRAISNLTRRGELVRTDDKRTGVYGRPEYLWRVAA